ncbi:YlqD family protein [Niallia oryzisoli]|uniref:YlqD family protein n=1 Tax=Niallia oryzisoli TaxID=1737571 RepID=A0ABZ2CKR6_9BACI
MKLVQSVVVKQVLTEKSKGELQKKYHTSLEQLQKECDQLRFELKKLEKSKKFQQHSLKVQFDKEIQSRLEKAKLIEFQLEQLHMLPIGSEIKESEVQALVEVNEGDRWSELVQRRTIVVKDDIVIEIR